jgi:hypothetical protein
MPSPFPGMDPWLEGPTIFPDLHNRLIAELSEAMNRQLPAPFYTAIANRIWIEQSKRVVEPDVNVLKPPYSNGIPLTNGGGLAVADQPEVTAVKVRVPTEEIVEWYLDVYAEPGGERIITTVEILSRANKRQGSDGRQEYLKKQSEVLQARINLVEIDLLRFGEHSTAVPQDRAQEITGAFDYHVCVHRYDHPNEFEVYPIHLPQRLPSIDVPLLPDVPDLRVNLQDLLNECYAKGLYGRRAHYQQPAPKPPFNEEQAKWAEQILRKKGLVP